ncbi:MAG: hypothetical protein Tsb009_17180 [Planctomycetaceae bacterium]
MTLWANINYWTHAFLLFAEGEEGGEQVSPFATFLPLFIILGVLYYFVVIRGNRRERERRESLLNSLKKNDRVVTIGGIIGTVASVSQDGREVTLKIDDNSKMKVLRTAIQGPLKEKEDGGKPAEDGSNNNGTSSENDTKS